MIRRFDLTLAVALLAAGCAKQAKPDVQQSNLPPPLPPARTQFLAPMRGDTLIEGQSFTIRFEAPRWDSVNVAVVMGGKDRGHLAFGLDHKDDLLVWQIPKGWVTGFGIARADNVRLRLEDAANPDSFVDSDTFTVAGIKR